MKRLMSSILIVLVISVLVSCFAGCISMDVDEGYDKLMMAYNNTKNNYSDIYQYAMKTYHKATPDSEGSLDNLVVNVNCAVDKHYNLIKDKNYAINIYEHRYIETMDDTMKATTKFVGSNDIRVGEAYNDDEKQDVDTLFLTAKELTMDGTKEKWSDRTYIQLGVNAKEFYKEEYMQSMTLMNTVVMEELGLLKRDDMDFDIDGGGVLVKGRTTDYTFKVTDTYLERYQSTHDGKSSLLDGKYVWIQTSYDRISNVYVYQEEKLGSGITAEYESLTFMVTYLGKHVDMSSSPKFDASATDNPYATIYENGTFKEGYLSSLTLN